MKDKEFMDYIAELEKYYGQSLNSVEKEVWYRNLSFMSIERFNLIMSEIYKTNKFMPKLSEVLDMNRQIPYTPRTDETQIKKHCEKCNDTGYIFYNKIIDGKNYQYAAVCDCGREQRYDGTKINDEKHRTKYYCPTVSEVGLENANNKPSNEEVLRAMKKLENSPIVSDEIKNIIREQLKKRSKTK